MDSPDPNERRTAMMEFNKLQVRVLPPAAQEDADNTPIAKIINFVQHNHANQLPTYEAEIIENDDSDDDQSD